MSSCTCLENVDKSKFGNSVKGLVSQKILENEQFLNTIVKAHVVLSNHDHQNTENPCESKWKGDTNEKKKSIDVSKLSFAQ